MIQLKHRMWIPNTFAFAMPLLLAFGAIGIPVLALASPTTTTLGGLNLDSYCQSIGQSSAFLNGSTWSCNPAGVAINITSACVWQYNDASATASQVRLNDPYSWTCYTNSSTPPPPLATTLGGLDLDGYCQSIGQHGSSLNGNDWDCSPSNAPINMTNACVWQYNDAGATASQVRSGDPYSWTCYTNSSTPPPPPPTTTPLGGLNLSGYCQSIGQSDSSLTGSTWSCSPSNTAVNMTNACVWQYNDVTASASQVRSGDPYSWTCYSGSSTPISVARGTPTATVQVASPGGNDMALFSIPFTVTAGGSDIFIAEAVQDSRSFNNPDKLSYSTTTTSTAGATQQPVAILSASTSGVGDIAGSRYKVLAGTSRTFTLQVAITASSTLSSGYVGVQMEGIAWGTSSASLTNYYTSNFDTFKTADVFIQRR